MKIAIILDEYSKLKKFEEKLNKCGINGEVYVFVNDLDEALFTIRDLKEQGYEICALL